MHYGYADNSGYGLGTDALPALTFADGTARVIDHMYVTNTTYLLNCLVNGNDLTAKIGPDDWVKLVATGYDTKGAKTGETGIYLCNGPDNIIMDWTKWDLSGLGKVAKVTFNVTGSSDNGYGFSQPAYFAYDDVAVRFEKGSSGEPEQPAAGPITVKVGETACAVTKVDSPDSSDAYKVTVDSGDNVTIEVKDAAFLVVTGASPMNFVNEEGVNPFTLTAAQLDGVALTAKQAATLVKFTPADNSKLAYLSIMDAMAGTSYHLFIERTVKAVPTASITLDKTELTLRPTEAAALTATVTPENTTDTVVWTSSNDAVSTVKDGVVTAVKEGTATITAQCGSVKAECTVTVLPPVLATSVTLDKTALTLYEGDAATLTATVTPENTTDKTVVWTSSDDAAATVKDGVITAVKAGTVTITAQCGDVKAQCAVTVKAPAVPSQKDGVYQIGTVDELIWFAKQVNGGNTAISGALTADIDLGGINWRPIGSYGTAFAGSFDGAGHGIKNMTVDYQTATSGNRVYLGLFGYVEGTADQRAAIKDLTVSGSVNAASEFSVYTGDVAGVVAYGNYVDISGVISHINVSVDAKVGNACGVGGLAGVLIDSTMTNCGNEGNVSGVKNLGGVNGGYPVLTWQTSECTNHTPGDAVKENIKDATCTAAGSHDEVISCTNCGKELSRSNVTDKALGHDWNSATGKCKRCETACDHKWTDGKCVTCGMTCQHTPGAVEKENVKAPTCTVDGSHDEVVYCTVCKAEVSRNTVTDKAPGHTEKPAVKENVKAPTCTVDGSHDEVVYCSVCKAEVSRTNVVDKAAGHKWNEGVVTTPSTTTAEGVRTFTCTVCQATRTESIPKIPTTPSRPGKPSVPAAKPVQSQKTGDAQA